MILILKKKKKKHYTFTKKKKEKDEAKSVTSSCLEERGEYRGKRRIIQRIGGWLERKALNGGKG